jgi:Coiled stalk of trimeric autotransporter adhesin
MATEQYAHTPDLMGNKVTNLGTGVAATDATTLAQVQALVAGATFNLSTHSLSELTAPTAALGMGNQKLSGLAAGVAATDAVNLGQVDARFTALIGAAPAALDTLVELAAQLQADESTAATLSTNVGTLTTRVTTAEGNITALQTAVAGRAKAASLLVGAVTAGTPINVVHNLGSAALVSCTVQVVAGGAIIHPSIVVVDANTVALTFAGTGITATANAYRCSVSVI